MKLINESGFINLELLTLIENTDDRMFVKDMNFVYIAASESYAINWLIETGEISTYGKEYLFDDNRVHSTLYWSKGLICSESGEHGLVGEIVDISDINKRK